MKKLILIGLTIFTTQEVTPFNLTQPQLLELGNKIWHRENGKSTEKLVWWNKGEPCASLGIGHFIWYPRTKSKKFTETFPSLIAFFIEKNVPLPAWLAQNPHQPCPWNSYEHFAKNSTSEKAKELRSLLANTLLLQIEFIVQRTERALPLMIDKTKISSRDNVKKQFYRIASDVSGVYALIDYIHFKGEGTNPKEQYAGHGWGLRFILQQMNGTETGTEALKEFTHIAKKVLEERVAHAPNQKIELSHLNGWKRRIDSYLSPKKF